MHQFEKVCFENLKQNQKPLKYINYFCFYAFKHVYLINVFKIVKIV